jgi:SAM-dependent methyltransferase
MPFNPIPMDQLRFIKKISEKDWMYKGKASYGYFLRGYEALAHCVNEVKKSEFRPHNILDFGCGHGCVARMLKAQFPSSTIYGQDVNPEWLEWCRDNLGIETIESAPQITDVTVQENLFDLIWVGSVFTHIPESSFDHLLDRLCQALTARGILIFTTAGTFVRKGFDINNEFLLAHDDAAAAVKNYDNDGFGFAPYTGGTYQDWGRSLVSFESVYRKVLSRNMRLISFQEGAWGRRQDVYAIVNE